MTQPEAVESQQQRRESLGRRPMLTPERQANIVRLVSAGSYLNVAAQHAGIGHSTLLSWLARGRKAAAARDAHEPDRLYCPDCDADRTDDVAAVHRLNDEERARTLDEEQRSYAALEYCPSCRSLQQPQPWQLPDAELLYLDFLEAVTRAETEAEVTAATAWRSAFRTDWRAARDYLVRRHPTRWAATQRVSISTEEAENRIDRAVADVLSLIGPGLDGDTDPASFDGLDLDVDLDAEDGQP